MEISGNVNIASFSVESIIYGHHLYKTIWSSEIWDLKKQPNDNLTTVACVAICSSFIIAIAT